MKRATAAAWLLATVGLLTLSAASAQTYPTRSIRIIGPSSPGGGIDATGRILAAALTQSLGQQVGRENRPGAGGIIGTELAAKAPPDGYTLMLTAAAAMVVFPHTFSKLHDETVKAIASPKVVQQISNAGAEAVSSTPEEFSGYIKAELARWGKAIKATGLPPE